jgi:hypothetical protein
MILNDDQDQVDLYNYFALLSCYRDTVSLQVTYVSPKILSCLLQNASLLLT